MAESPRWLEAGPADHEHTCTSPRRAGPIPHGGWRRAQPITSTLRESKAAPITSTPARVQGGQRPRARIGWGRTRRPRAGLHELSWPGADMGGHEHRRDRHCLRSAAVSPLPPHYVRLRLLRRRLPCCVAGLPDWVALLPGVLVGASMVGVACRDTEASVGARGRERGGETSIPRSVRLRLPLRRRSLRPWLRVAGPSDWVASLTGVSAGASTVGPACRTSSRASVGVRGREGEGEALLVPDPGGVMQAAETSTGEGETPLVPDSWRGRVSIWRTARSHQGISAGERHHPHQLPEGTCEQPKLPLEREGERERGTARSSFWRGRVSSQHATCVSRRRTRNVCRTERGGDRERDAARPISQHIFRVRRSGGDV